MPDADDDDWEEDDVGSADVGVATSALLAGAAEPVARTISATGTRRANAPTTMPIRAQKGSTRPVPMEARDGRHLPSATGTSGTAPVWLREPRTGSEPTTRRSGRVGSSLQKSCSSSSKCTGSPLSVLPAWPPVAECPHRSSAVVMKTQHVICMSRRSPVRPCRDAKADRRPKSPGRGAEGVGFEPTDHRLDGPRISSAVRSTWLRHLSNVCAQTNGKRPRASLPSVSA